jgi:hypothetical protein
MMGRLKKMFTRHPESVGETYFEHMCWAIFYSMSLTLAGAACAIHSVFPFLFEKTASSITEWVLNTNERRKNDYDK